MSHQVGAEENSNTIENEDIDFESYSSRLSKVQSYKISLPDLLNEFDDGNFLFLSFKFVSGSLIPFDFKSF